MASLKVKFMVAITLILWSSAFVGIRIGLTGYSPGSLALLRFLVASLCMVFIYHRQTHKKIPWPDRLRLMALGMLGIGVYHISLNYGEVDVAAGVASFIIGLMPVITLLLSVIFLHERPGISIYIGFAVSFLGLLCMVMAENTHGSATAGMLDIFIAALAGSLFCVLLKQFLRRYDPIAVSAWTMWGGTLLLLIFAGDLWQEIGNAPLNASLSAVYMGIFPGALAYLAWSYVLNAMSASNASIYLYAMPVISTLLGFLVLHEQPSLTTLAGGLLAVTGALYATSRVSISKSIHPKEIVL